MMVLEMAGVRKDYTRAGKTFAAVSRADLNSGEGEIVGITGPSGSGKSTLFNIIAGLVQPTAGSIRILGRDITGMSRSLLAEMRRTDIGVVLQGRNLLQNFTVLENICMPAALGKRSGDAVRKGMELLETFGLKGMENEYPSVLSGGERRRVSIIRAFVHTPKLVIADEPTSNLDDENARIIMDAFKEASERKVTILVSSHDVNLLPKYATRKYTMIQGELSPWE